MLLRTTNLLRSATSIGRTLFQAANALPTGDYTTEEAKHWVTDILAGGWAASLHCLFHQGIVILWEAHEFEYCWVAEGNFGCRIMWRRVGMHDPSFDESINRRIVFKAASRLAHLVESW